MKGLQFTISVREKEDGTIHARVVAGDAEATATNKQGYGTAVERLGREIANNGIGMKPIVEDASE